MFVDGDADGGRQVQTSDGAGDRQPQGVVVVRVEKLRRKPGRFTSEHEHVARTERRFPDRPPRRFGEKEVAAFGEGLGERFPIRDVFEVEVLPIVESGAAEPFFIEPEGGRSDDPELGPDRDARATDVPRVLRDLGLVQHDV